MLQLTCLAQRGGKSISVEDSLKDELRKTTFILESTHKKFERLAYVLTAKEMAVRSLELDDSIYQGLVSVQAFNFNKNHEGNRDDIDIYRCLHRALQSFEDPILATLPKTPNKKGKDLLIIETEMANKLCSRLKRNMTLDEWNKFSFDLPYEKTCTAFYSNSKK